MEGFEELVSWRQCPHSLGTLWLHGTARYNTCKMVVEQEVGNSIQASDGSIL